jgi:hypothetical protein
MKNVLFEQLTKRCFTGVVEKRESETYDGFGLFATKAHAPGDILFEEYPVGTSAVPYFEKAGECCSNCVRPLSEIGEKRIACTEGCHEVYCSSQCRQWAWELYHSTLCVRRNHHYMRYYAIAKQSENEYYLVAARLLIMFPSAPWIFHFCSPRWSTLVHLSSPEALEEETEEMSRILSEILRGQSGKSEQVTQEVLSRTIGMLRVNVLTIKHEDENLGFALYSTQSLMNHSEDPNCRCVTISCDAVPNNPCLCGIEAVKEIMPGEELIIDYLAATQGDERARILLYQYGIVEKTEDQTKTS